VIRTAVLAVFMLAAVAAPAWALESHSAPAPKAGGAFTDSRIFQGMTPETASEPFHFGPAEPQALAPAAAQAKKPMVVYDLSSGKMADNIDVADPRDNPFMPQPEPSPRPAH
jgi:hypothetical protein